MITFAYYETVILIIESDKYAYINKLYQKSHSTATISFMILTNIFVTVSNKTSIHSA